MQIDIDARGLACPRPVMLTKERLSQAAQPFSILVDNEAAKENVSRFAKSQGCDVEINNHEGGFLIKVTPRENSTKTAEKSYQARPNEVRESTVIFIKTDEIGKGDRKLGETLMKSFLFALTESDVIPDKIALMNTGVRLATSNEDAVMHLKAIEDKGVEIIACGTCLEFYGLKDQLKAGRIGNMYEIISTLIAADKIISL